MEQNANIMRLAKPKMKGIWGLVFSRLLIVVVLIVLQVLLYLSFMIWLRQYIPHYAVIQIMFTVIMVLYLFNNRMDSTAKLTWLALIAVVPLLGAFLLMYTQTNIGHRATRSRVEQLIADTKNTLPQEGAVMEKLEGDVCGTDDLHRYLNRSGCFPIFDGTEVQYFPLGEDKFAAMLAELEKAEKFIFMEYFILEEGYMWGRILDILVKKAKAGVDVRVMYDGTCEFSLLPHDYPKRLEAVGIKAKAFAPVTPFISTHYNYRDHRKILVSDGKVAFNGGVNLADEYINRKERFGHWKDTALMLRGKAVQSFTLMFLQMWNISEKEPDFSPCLIPGDHFNAEGFVMPFGDCPLDEDKVGESVYMDILNRANDYVHIMTPYLILDGELETALKYAAQRGVDVKIILPGIPDKKMAYSLAKSHYSALLDAGVKIYEYTPGFVHAKVFVSDGIKAVIGTINLDYRSLYHHFECGTYLYKTPCIAPIESDFANTLSKCRQVTRETVKNEKLSYKVMGSLMKIVAPLI